jgi:hypothetical protein
MRIIEQPYITPTGYIDFPFAYVYDGTTLTDGNNYQSVTKQLQGDSDFILRRIVGVPNVVASGQSGGRFNYRNSSQSYAAGNPGSGVVFNNVWPVVPEKLYAKNTQIVFDLYDVSRNFNTCSETPIYNAYIAFMGVKRFTQSQGYNTNTTQYRYRPLKYSYSYNLTINWAHFTAAGGVNGPQRFSQLLDTYDFELLRIAACYSNSVGSTGTLQTNDFGITLYDSNGHQLSDLPLNQGYINNGRRTPALGPPYSGLMPVPSLVYPGGSAIVFDITSQLCSSQLPQTYNITFDGTWRVPC